MARTDNYSHLECDVAGCDIKLDAPSADIDSYGWVVGAEYTTSDGTVRRFDVCPEHYEGFVSMRKAQDEQVDGFFSKRG